MCLLLETIKIVEHNLINLEYHQQRVNRSIRGLFNKNARINLVGEIKVPVHLGKGLFKCRVVYNHEIIKMEFLPYKQPEITTLKLVTCNGLDYYYKFENRQAITELLKLKGRCDDILILKNDLVTDTSFCNIIFSDGNNWVTPSKPLLKGTQREYLLEKGIVSEAKIKSSDIYNFNSFKLINAMIDFEISQTLPATNILR
jgi:4-amino-4-deoxychorismate lyase